MRATRLRHVIAAGASLALLAACGTPPPVAVERASRIPDETPPTTPDTEPTEPTTPTTPPTDTGPTSTIAPANDVIDFGDGTPLPSDAFLIRALTDVEAWWAEQYPIIYGEAFTPLSGGIHAASPERTTPLPGCGEPETTYEDVTLFVAFYCSEGDFIIYDDGAGSTIDVLAQELGDAVVGVILAHEFAHAIQQRSGALALRLATVFTEQQADCFSGAWTARAQRGESPIVSLTDRDVRSGLIAMIEVRDPIGLNQLEEGGHGSAFDRVGAFQVGFSNGPERCAELIENPLQLMPNEFQRTDDAARGGDAPYGFDAEQAQIYGILVDDLNAFWPATFAATGGTFPTITLDPIADPAQNTCTDLTGPVDDAAAYCPSTQSVVFDEPYFRSLYDDLGDFAIGYLIGDAWGEAVQEALASPLTGEPRSLLSDCLVGAWVRDIIPGIGEPATVADRSASVSPGDLDEAIQTAILVGDTGFGDDVVGSGFEKIASFREGVLGGLDVCSEQLGG